MAVKSLFSHVEILGRNELLLEDALPAARHVEEPLVCVYQTDKCAFPPIGAPGRLQTWSELLPRLGGLDRPLGLDYRTVDWLPEAPEGLVTQLTFPMDLAFEPALKLAVGENITGVAMVAHAHECPAFIESCRRYGLPYRIFLAGAEKALVDDHTHITFFDGPPLSGYDALAQLPPTWADLGPWGNPYRLEALKLIGLEIIARGGHDRPTLVVHDECGELLYALHLASTQYQRITAKESPYRIIAVQRKPYDAIARQFEGVEADLDIWREDRDFVHPPRKGLDAVRHALLQHMGTCIALDEAECLRYFEERKLPPPEGIAGLFTPALHKLWRTHFIDDEDAVILLDAKC